MYTTILTLYRQGISQRQISKITSSHRNTIKTIIDRFEKDKIEFPLPYKRSSKVANWHEEIITLTASNLSLVRIYEKLKLQGFDQSYNALTHYIRLHKIKQDTCIRFITNPGEEAQVDFGYVGLQYNSFGQKKKAYIFNMRLSYSRYDYYEIVFDQKVETWIRCHTNAFTFFGRAPKVIKLDNLKAGVLNANIYEPLFQKEYKELSDHYGCLLSPCRPCKPQEKGKVESGIKYVKNNFFAGRKFRANADMNQELAYWLLKANDRIHGTTKARPRELYEKHEKMAMLVLPTSNYNKLQWLRRKVAKDCHVTIDNNYYSVPFKYVGEEVDISLSSTLVQIYSINNLVATHTRSKAKGDFITSTSHYNQYKQYCPGLAEYDKKCENDLRSLGCYCAEMLKELQEHQKDWQRAVRGILSLRKIYNAEDINLACQRAVYFGIYTYSIVKKILASNSYHLPLNEIDGGSYASNH